MTSTKIKPVTGIWNRTNTLHKEVTFIKDWTGNSKAIYSTIGASNHSDSIREENDFYATDPRAVEILLENESFAPNILEPACGAGHISKVLEAHGYDVTSHDLIYRGYGVDESINFLEDTPHFNGDIITNPPYSYAREFVETALDIIDTGNKVAMFLKLTFLEGKGRKELFKKYPPKTIYVFSGRVNCGKNGVFDGPASAVAYAWFVWEKGFTGDPSIRWVN